MILFKAARMIQHFPNPAEMDDDSTAALVQTAEDFLRSGGAVSLSEWSMMSPIERAALVAAGNRLRADMAASTGFAAQGPEQAAAVAEPADGGVSRDKLALAKAAARAAAKTKGAVVS